jgi:signal transduction histidine kinase
VVVAAAFIPVALVLPALPPAAAHLYSYVQGVAYILTVGLFFWLAGTALFRDDRTFPGWLMVGFLIHGLSIIYSFLENLKLVPPLSVQELLLERGHLIALHTPVVLMVGLLVEMAIVLLIGMRRFKHLLAEQQRLARELAQQRQQNLNALALGMETEQRRIAQELHDGLGGGIAAAKFKLEKIESENPAVPGLGGVVRELADMHTELRDIAHNLMPKHLHKQGLLPAVEQLVQRMESADNRLKINLFCNADLSDVNELARVYLYRIAQELLGNLLKHAQASEAWLQFVRDGDNLLLTLEDNGRGFDSNPKNSPSGAGGRAGGKAGGIGLDNIRYRVEDALGGKFSVESEPGKGALFTIEVPWKALA